MTTNLKTGEFFEMLGYDALATMQSVADEMVSYIVLTNNSTHILLAEMHAMSESSEKMQEPGKLVAAYPYGATDDDWKTAYRIATVEAMRLSHIAPPADDEACPGCGCIPGDGLTDGCFHPVGCGYYKRVDERD